MCLGPFHMPIYVGFVVDGVDKGHSFADFYCFCCLRSYKQMHLKEFRSNKLFSGVYQLVEAIRWSLHDPEVMYCDSRRTKKKAEMRIADPTLGSIETCRKY